MSAQLLQIVAQLDRPGATEVVIATGRQVAVRVDGAYQTLTQTPVTIAQLMHLIRGTPLGALVPGEGELSEPSEVDIGGRRVFAHIVRHGEELLCRIEKRAPAPDHEFQRDTPEFQHKNPATVAKRAPTQVSGPVAVPQQQPSSPAIVFPPSATDTAHLVDEPSEVTANLASLVRDARRRAATDLHISANRPILVRALGELSPLGDPTPIANAAVEALILPLLGPLRRAQLASRGYVDLAVDVPGAGRLRGNVSRQQGGLKAAFRLALTKPPTLDELGLPAAVAKVTEHHQGLVVIAGPSGHGKTTTLAALVDRLNAADPIHILTIEDPVEIEHPKKAAVISQREVGRHTLSFAAALKASLREDPDVIVIGELRDRETVEIALTAAETGHLVLATMSTPSAAKTIDRLIDMFPPDDQSQVRASLAGALRAIVAQRLMPNAQGTGVVAALELLVGVLPLATLIRDNKLYQLPNLMMRGKAFGMIRLDDSLLEHVRAGRLTEEAALRAAESRKDMATVLAGGRR